MARQQCRPLIDVGGCQASDRLRLNGLSDLTGQVQSFVLRLASDTAANAIAAVPLHKCTTSTTLCARAENYVFVASGTAATGQRRRPPTPSWRCRSYQFTTSTKLCAAQQTMFS